MALKVCSVFGREGACQVDESQKTGRRSAQWLGENLSGGIDIYASTAGGISEVRVHWCEGCLRKWQDFGPAILASKGQMKELGLLCLEDEKQGV